MRCPRCDAESPAGMRFCGQCAAPLASACPSCGAENPPGHKFCGQCATPLANAGPPRLESPGLYTPKHLAEKILTSRRALEGERKQVTVLFADLKGSLELLADRDPEEARKLLDPVLERLMEAVHRYEGTVNQIMGDGIMALFGAPVAYEDHAVRACYAAIDMQAAIRRYAADVWRDYGIKAQIRVGLNSGEVVVRAIGSDLRVDYSAVGQTTHLASRMEQLATPGTVLLTADTLRLAEGYVTAKPLGPVPVKGLEAPLEVYELTGAGPLRSRLHAAAARGLTRFVGREGELDQLRGALARTTEGHGQVVAIVGEPGVGKSRLVWEVTHSHRVHGWLVLQAGSVSYGKATSYLPVIDLLKGYFAIEDRDGPRAVQEKVTGKLLTLDRALEDHLPALLSLLDVPTDDPQWVTLDPLQRRRRTLDAVKRLLLRESQVQPLLVVFEDLHWIDSETQALLEGLVESLPAARLLLLVNYRLEYQHVWGSRTYYTQLRLDPLPTEGAERLLAALLGSDAGLEPLTHVLITQTEGNPFFLEESVRTLVETGALAGERGAYHLARPLPAIQVPATVQAVLAARIDRLSPADKALLQTASVVGKDVPLGVLQTMAELAEDELHAAIGRLQAAEFLYETSLFPNPEYTFKHALTHEVAYGGLLAERRRALHARAAETIEARFGDRLAEHVEQLAHHALRGEVWDKALHYMRRAGQKAASRSAHREAVVHFDQALAALGQLPDTREARTETVDLHLELRSSLRTIGELPRGLEVLHRAERIAAALGDRRRQGLILSHMGNHYYEITETERSLDCCERALAIARELGDRELEALAAFPLGQNHFSLGNYARAIDLLEQSSAGLAERPGEYHEWIFMSLGARGFLGRALIEVGEFRQATIVAEQVITASRGRDFAFGLSHGLYTLGLVSSRLGDHERAVALLEESLDVARKRMLTFVAPLVGAQLGYSLARVGRAQEGLPLIERAEHEAKANGHWGMAMLAKESIAETYLLGDRREVAAGTGRAGLASYREARRC